MVGTRRGRVRRSLYVARKNQDAISLDAIEKTHFSLSFQVLFSIYRALQSAVNCFHI